ncbi:SRPBCC family protein [Flavobacterium sp.]|uniref:SRPBCC family protein n=1 Tax=Flavobacterium sp. TaxID=239 RepID=UPI0037509D40
MRKFLKYLFIIILLFVITAAVCTFAFTENTKIITLERSVEINAPKERVFEYISHTENKTKWINPDKKMERSTTGKDAAVGFVRSWESQNPPEKGSETITKIELGKSVETKVENNLNGQQTSSEQKLSSESLESNKTLVTWKIESTIPLNFASRMLLGFVEMMAKSVDNQDAYDKGVQSGLEKEGVYKDADENLQKLKNNIEIMTK